MSETEGRIKAAWRELENFDLILERLYELIMQVNSSPRHVTVTEHPDYKTWKHEILSEEKRLTAL